MIVLVHNNCVQTAQPLKPANELSNCQWKTCFWVPATKSFMLMARSWEASSIPSN